MLLSLLASIETLATTTAATCWWHSTYAELISRSLRDRQPIFHAVSVPLAPETCFDMTQYHPEKRHDVWRGDVRAETKN